MAGLFEDDAVADASGALFAEPGAPQPGAPQPVAPEPGAPEPGALEQALAYRVLARKYRPKIFDDLIGQDALVRTLRNAFAMNRIAHAFMLTGVRGVGKTTTARILARALNCTGPDGTGGPTPDPCGVCDNCIAILADRHPDVVEMDAASNTGVEDVREIIEATKFRPLSARTKIFIIDEVHMLSRNAFNALLKTLEEPPPHIKFVLATTEIRKVPVTVLSRCQRFDLRRVAVAELTAHFARIAQAEGITVAPPALDHIARAADGSVRDGLSLLDQAIALAVQSGVQSGVQSSVQSGAGDGGEISGAMVAEMLGLADRGQVFDLMEAVIAGDAAAALTVADAAYARGADLGVLLGDLLGLSHLLTRLKAVPALGNSNALPEAERTRGAAMAAQLPLSWLGRMWQMLLKGVAEVDSAPDRRAAAEMILIRLCHVADLPPPGELVRRLSEPNAPRGAPANGGGSGGSGARAVAGGGAVALATPAPVPVAVPVPLPRNMVFADVVALAERKRDAKLYAHLRHSVHLVRFAPPVIELRLRDEAPRDLAAKLAALLEAETNFRWTIALSHAEGEPTIDAAETATATQAEQDAAAHPLVQAILAAFPGARIESRLPAPEPAVGPPPDWAAYSPPDELYSEGDDI